MDGLQHVTPMSFGKGAIWVAGFYVLGRVTHLCARTCENGLYTKDAVYLAAVCILCITMLLTRLSFTRRSTYSSTVPLVPYWMPGIGNLPGLIFTGVDQFLTQIR